MTTKYYIEFECPASDTNYIAQSRWFEYKEHAIMWYRDSFDYIDTEEMCVRLMKADFTNNEMGDIEFVEDVTTQHYLKPPRERD